MHFHQHGYVSEDPRTQRARGHGLDRPTELPEETDVLIVGSGPAGMIAAAQLAQYPEVDVRIIEQRPGRLEIGQADGIQARSVETFQAFGFADEVIAEAYHITEMCFWKPDPQNPEHIIRTSRTPDDPTGVSEFPHLIVNQARVLDYFAEFARRSPGRITPDYGVQFLGLEVQEEEGERPVVVRVKHTAGPRAGEERTVRAKYVIGCDGARSAVRKALGIGFPGGSVLINRHLLRSPIWQSAVSAAGSSASAATSTASIGCPASRSASITFSTYSAVIGSMYVASANSGSVMIVAGLELTRMTRTPSSRRTRQAWVPE